MKLTARYLGHPERPVIGELFEAPDHRIYFQFHPEWRDLGLELSPFYLPSSTETSLPTPTPQFSPLFGLFDDSLPDWWGQQLLKKFFEEKGIRWNRVGVLQKLAAQGDYGIGAIGYEPDEAPDDFRSQLAIEVGALADAARGIIEGESERTLPLLIRSGITAGGAQPKALIHLSEDFKTVWPGGGNPPSGSTPWLIKFQLDREVHTTREEHAFALMAAAAGIDIVETRLLTDQGGSVHFVCRRFDRDAGEKIHFHSYSGLTHSRPGEGLEYGDLMNLTRTLCLNENAVEEVFRRAVFNVAAGNDDDHGRNHAFLMNSQGEWRPSPAYDITFATHPLATNLRSASVMGRFASVTRSDLTALAKDQGIRRVDDSIDQVLTAIRRWPEFADAARIPETHAALLARDFPASEW
ncbi:type II toxin-antitoxin system HipA family toxin [Haloferula chungangensis]|uniref:Type II toxin-antitoxin system HipA family toxin n=1 Tax=Haloferula chungangensis TaxID=1048331 RepID=A0ABW2L1Q6_9BACT